MAKKSVGKIFEEEIKASFPADFYVERYKDDTSGFHGVSNPADFRIYKYPLTFLLELKSHKGKSIPLAKIRSSQLKGMEKANPHKGIYCGFILNYRDLEETYYITFSVLVSDYYIKNDKGEFEVNPTGRKSIPIEWCREYGVRIEQEKKRVRYSYDLSSWLEEYYMGNWLLRNGGFL